MTTDWNIRKATLEESSEIALCIDAAYADYGKSIDDLPPVSQGMDREITDNQVWVAETDGEITGVLVLASDRSFMKLANLAVRPDHGGKGLGRTLINHAENQAALQRYPEIRLNTHKNMKNNLHLYGKLGWTEIARRANTVTMAKRL